MSESDNEEEERMSQQVLRIHKVLNVCGRICPDIMITVRDTLKKMRNGQILEVISDYKPSATETIPNFCRKKGYAIDIIDESDGMYRMLIRV